MSKKAANVPKEHLQSEDYSLQKIRKALAENNACYVLITCAEPSESGEMQVEMHYEGDEAFASYLVEGAHQAFEERSLPRKE